MASVAVALADGVWWRWWGGCGGVGGAAVGGMVVAQCSRSRPNTHHEWLSTHVCESVSVFFYGRATMVNELLAR